MSEVRSCRTIGVKNDDVIVLIMVLMTYLIFLAPQDLFQD